MKKAINRWLEKLAKANKDNFGTERLDCCELGKKTNDPNPRKTNSISTNRVKK